jgi:hypothetical protein
LRLHDVHRLREHLDALGTNWHRNVIFRNDRVVKQPINAIDMAIQPNDSPTTDGRWRRVPPSWTGDTSRRS